MIWRAIYYIVMTAYAALIAFVIADSFSSFFGNFAVQIFTTCGGFIALSLLWHHRPESDNNSEGSDRLADQEWD